MSIAKKIALITSNALILMLVASVAFAQDPAAAAEVADKIVYTGDDMAMRYLAAGLSIAIAACGCGIGQGLTGRGALEGIARNPGAYSKIFTPMIIAFALIESLAIYALLVSMLAIFA